MGFFSKLFGRESKPKTGGMEDYMTLIRVYFQAAIAAEAGITNLAALPDLRVFKTTLKVPTQNNKLGVGEKARCKKMLKELYNTEDVFFKEIDQSIHKNCRKVQDVQTYLIQFQDFTQELIMLLSNMMKLKLRLPSFFKSAIYSMTEKTVSQIFTKNDFTDPATVKAVMTVRKYSQKLGFSQDWITKFAYQVIMLAKKEPKQKEASGAR